VAEKIVGRRETALVVLTGSGLKDVKSALRAAGQPVSLRPDDGELAAYLKDRPLA
jgi:threonine synthase